MQCKWCGGSVLYDRDRELCCISCGRFTCSKCGGVFIPKGGHLVCWTCGQMYGYGQEMARGGKGGGQHHRIKEVSLL